MSEERKKVTATKGLRQLEELLRDTTQKDLGAELGIQQSVLSEILNLWRLPTLEQAIKLETKKQIPVLSWAEADDEQSSPAAE